MFVRVSPLLKDSIWTYLEQYDLPVVVGPHVQNGPQPIATQVGLSLLNKLFNITSLENISTKTYNFCILFSGKNTIFVFLLLLSSCFLFLILCFYV